MSASIHQALTANTVSSIAVTATSGLEVLSRDGSAEVYFTLNGTDPTVGGTDTFVLPALVGSLTLGANEIAVAAGFASAPSVTVKLISAGAPKVSVRGW